LSVFHKRFLFVAVVFSLVFLPLTQAGEWQKAKDVYYQIIKEVKKGDQIDLLFPMTEDTREFSVVAIGKGTGNFDVDMGLMDAYHEIKSKDTEIGDVAVVSHQFDFFSETVTVKLVGMSGKGTVILYAGNTEKLLKRLMLNYSLC
jgi:hypothetical protein